MNNNDQSHSDLIFAARKQKICIAKQIKKRGSFWRVKLKKIKETFL